MKDRNRNELWGRVLVEELVRAGVREVVVSPGSRSTPVVLAVAAHPALKTLVSVDERSAAFLALGVGKGSGRPGAVITTSGTAAANLMPAVVESAQSETPLLLLTADRPPRLRGADANQAIEQQHLFGRYPRFYHELSPAEVSEATVRHLRSVVCRAVAVAVGDPAGPVHLNLPFDKPLEPVSVEGDLPGEWNEEAPPVLRGRADDAPYTRIHARRLTPSPRGVASLERRLSGARRPLLVAGPLPRPWETGPSVRGFAARMGIPLLADPLSGARFPSTDEADGSSGVPAVGGYDIALRDPEVRQLLRPDLVLRIGASPTSSSLLGWLEALGEVSQVVVDGGERWKDHLAVAHEMIPADPGLLLDALAGEAAPADSRWRRLWEKMEEVVIRAMMADRPGVEGPSEGTLAGHLIRMLPADDILFVSGSMPIRDVDAFGCGRADPLTVLGNRGASGIDGIISSAAGVSLATGRRVVALVGDLALLHDSAGLALLQQPGVRVAVVVINNDGGGIFHFLPIRDHEPAFTRFFATPHGRDLSRLAELHGLGYAAVELRPIGHEGKDPGSNPDSGAVGPKMESFERALESALQPDGGEILEVRTDREVSRRRREAALDRIASQVAHALRELRDASPT